MHTGRIAAEAKRLPKSQAQDNLTSRIDTS
jgi:hypothetical protein